MPPFDALARRRAHVPERAHSILEARTLHNSHRRLAELLRPGMTVLDAGCGTGAITRGVAEAVSPNGYAMGADVDAALIERARRTHRYHPRLSFCVCDIYRLPFRNAFDLVSASRVLQWLAHPLEALRSMTRAAKPGGRVLVLDYNHEKIGWQPNPPDSVKAFYDCFLRWRSDSGMDNAVADKLGGLLAMAGLIDVIQTEQHEVTRRADPDFEARIGIWGEVIASRGHQMVADGFLAEMQRGSAHTEYRHWMRERAESQLLYLVAAEGIRPPQM